MSSASKKASKSTSLSSGIENCKQSVGINSTKQRNLEGVNHSAVSLSKESSSNFRRPGQNKDSLKNDKADRTRSSYKSLSSNSRAGNTTNRKPKESSKGKSEFDKSNLEAKIKDLMTIAKTKDSEIKSLKQKLEQMMQLRDEKEAPSVVEDESKNEMQKELSRLLKENLKLKEDLESSKTFQSSDSLSASSSNRSASVENIADGGLPDESVNSTPDDCVSESSSVTVACLTERIHQMEENHISTHEELEATVQELNDLQKSIPELTIDNNRLQQEKDILKVKVEKLEKRLTQQSNEINHLRVLVSDRFSDGAPATDLQQQYIRLLDERKELLQYQDALGKEVEDAGAARNESQELVYAMQERMRHLERELNQANTEKSLLDKKLKTLKENTEQERLQTVNKLEEELRLERERNDDQVDSDNSVDKLRVENRKLTEQFHLAEEEGKRWHQECERMDAKIAELEEEQEAYSAKSKRDLSELSELIDKLNEELHLKQASLDEANETLFVMEDSVEQHMAVKKHDNHIIQQLQNQVSSLKEERFRLEKEIQQLKKEQRNQSEEWKQFQNDLQMAVMIANDMKAETQSEVSRLRETNQNLEEDVTKLRVENDQLRRKWMSSVSGSSAAILEASSLRQSNSNDLVTLRESFTRRESSPGVQGLIKSFNKQTSDSPVRPLLSPESSFKVRSSPGPVTAAVSPIPRHHSINNTPSPSSQIPSDTLGSKPGTSDSNRGNELSSLLRRNSAQDTRKTQEAIPGSGSPKFAPQILTPAKPSSGGDSLASLARRYGGSKRNALLQWCREKTSSHHGVDITNFSSSWSDGLALCALLHAYLPAHIPYETLRQNYENAADDASRQQLQAKNFRLAFAAAESVGIEPTLTKEEMTTKERPDWQRVMAYVTQIYKYFET